MDILNLALKYYINVTGRTVKDFYSNLLTALSDDLGNQTGDLWLIHALVIRIEQQGIPFKAILDAEPLVSKQFDNLSENKIQLYNMNKVWGKETYSSIVNNIGMHDYLIWNLNSCDNVISYFDNNVTVVNTGTSFNILNSDIETIVTNTLPDCLKGAIFKNEKILVLSCIPQYKENTVSYITEAMCENNFSDLSENVYFQYLWQLLQLKTKYNLTNMYIGFYGDSCIYTEKEYLFFMNYFKRNFEFMHGFCFSLKDFGVTLLNIKGLHFSLWKTNNSEVNKEVLLWKKRLATKTRIETGELILYDIDRGSVTEWVQPKDILFYTTKPVMTNYGTFLNGSLFDRKVNVETKCAENSLGSMLVSDSMKDIDKVILLSGMSLQPKGKSTRIKVVDITEENFWRCVSLFAFTRLVNKNWNNEKMTISVPNENVEGYKIWVYNALPLFLFDSRAMFSSIRNVEWNNTIFNLSNKMFFMDKQSISLFCNDNNLSYQLDSLDNSYLISQLNIAKQYWSIETNQLFEFCFDMTQRTFDERLKKRYSFGTDAIDAGFSQITATFDNDILYMNNFVKLFTVYKEYLYKDLSKFGFLREV